MGPRLILVAAVAVATMAWVAPVSAHGDHDARPLARQLHVGPFVVSLWQVYPDAGETMTPHLIVIVDGGATAPAAEVGVAANRRPLEVRASTTTTNGFETAEGVADGDVLTVTISDGTQAWALDPVVIPPAPTSMLPMQELIYISIFLTAGTALWAAGRTGRAWRRSAVSPS